MVVTRHLRAHLNGEVEVVAAAAGRSDVPRPPGVGRRRKVPGELLGIVAEAGRRHHHRAGGQRVLVKAAPHASTYARPYDGAVLGEQAADAASERDLDSGAAAVAGEHVDHGLAAPDRAVHPRPALVTAEHQLVVELRSEVAEPFHRRAGQLGQPPDHRRLDLPLVELHVFVK
jgi:hypothetical protein